MQNKNKFSSAIFGNWVVKVFSFLVALGIVVAVRFLNVTDRVVTIPITVKLNASSPFEPVSLVPESIDVVITGDDDIVYLVDPSLITASVDFSDVGGERYLLFLWPYHKIITGHHPYSLPRGK